jgi:hypothetical protein
MAESAAVFRVALARVTRLAGTRSTDVVLSSSSPATVPGGCLDGCGSDRGCSDGPEIQGGGLARGSADEYTVEMMMIARARLIAPSSFRCAEMALAGLAGVAAGLARVARARAAVATSPVSKAAADSAADSATDSPSAATDSPSASATSAAPKSDVKTATAADALNASLFRMAIDPVHAVAEAMSERLLRYGASRARGPNPWDPLSGLRACSGGRSVRVHANLARCVPTRHFSPLHLAIVPHNRLF